MLVKGAQSGSVQAATEFRKSWLFALATAR